MNEIEIITVLRELHNVTGLRVSLHDSDYKEIAAYPPEALPFCRIINSIEDEHKKCIECDMIACERAIETRESYIYKCRYGLSESVSPLYNFGELTGFLMMGQVAASKSEAISACVLASDILGKGAIDLAERIPTVKDGKIYSYAKIMEICARYLTLAGAMEAKQTSISIGAKKYIHANYKNKILIKDICEHLGCSKSTLLNCFTKDFGMTVNSYITSVRLEEAMKMIERTTMTVSEIATSAGFSDQAYFSKVFSAKYGAPPGKYRKTNRS